MSDLPSLFWAIVFAYAASLAWDGWRKHVEARSSQMHSDVADELLRRMANLEAQLMAEIKAVRKLYERRHPDA